MPLTRIRLAPGRSRADALYEHLRDAILRGELHPNERLIEVSIAELASVSRTPVREALHRLRIDGLVEETSNGAVVGTFTVDQLAERCAVREALEGLAARLAASSRSEFELLAIGETLVGYREALAAGATDKLVTLNRAFHAAIAQAAHNRYLGEQLATLRGHIDRLQASTLLNATRQREALEEHEAMYDAIAARDGDAAEAAARRHSQRATALRLHSAQLEAQRR